MRRPLAQALWTPLSINQVGRDGGCFLNHGQSEVSALASGPERDQDCLTKREDSKCKWMFVKLQKGLRGQVMRSKNMLHEETKQTVQDYNCGWHRRLKRLGKTVAILFLVLFSLVGICVRDSFYSEPNASSSA